MINETFQKLINKDAFSDIIGQENTKQQLLSALIMNRHIVIVGSPGIGKTTLAKNVAKLLPSIKANDCEFHCDPSNPICPKCKSKKSKIIEVKGEKRFVRIQGSPDLTVEDLLGDIDPIKAMQYGPLSVEAFTPGKIFKANNGVLFFDELNRLPEKLQNALLQVLEEGKATIGSYDIDFPANFIFISTMNPEDFAGTERLSEVLLDRLDVVYMGYPESLDIEKKIVKNKSEVIKTIEFPENLLNLTLQFVRYLRENKDLERVPSVRVSIGLFERAQSNALIDNRKKVEMKDVEKALMSVVAHRIRLKPSVKYLMKPEEFVRKELKQYIEEREESGDVP